MNPEITFTSAAITHIKNMLATRKQAKGLRLSIKTTGCSGYAYLPEIIENEKPGDIHLQQDDLQIFLDPQCLALIKGVTVDYVTETGAGLKQKRLVFINPNEKSRCGCGESFNV